MCLLSERSAFQSVQIPWKPFLFCRFILHYVPLSSVLVAFLPPRRRWVSVYHIGKARWRLFPCFRKVHDLQYQLLFRNRHQTAAQRVLSGVAGTYLQQLSMFWVMTPSHSYFCCYHITVDGITGDVMSLVIGCLSNAMLTLGNNGKWDATRAKLLGNDELHKVLAIVTNSLTTC